MRCRSLCQPDVRAPELQQQASAVRRSYKGKRLRGGKQSMLSLPYQFRQKMSLSFAAQGRVPSAVHSRETRPLPASSPSQSNLGSSRGQSTGPGACPAAVIVRQRVPGHRRDHVRVRELTWRSCCPVTSFSRMLLQEWAASAKGLLRLHQTAPGPVTERDYFFFLLKDLRESARRFLYGQFVENGLVLAVGVAVGSDEL
jgi:hypothetical protein